MMNIFKRLLKIGQAEIHALVDKMEDPITLTEEGIRDMKTQLADAMEAYAKVRATAIRFENRAAAKADGGARWTEKARAALQKVQEGALDPVKAEKLATEALLLKKRDLDDAHELRLEGMHHASKADEIHTQIEILKFNISKWEKELTTLKAKQKVNQAALFANQHMAHIDTNSTLDMLQRMKTKVAEDGALAEAYAEIAQEQTNAPQQERTAQQQAVQQELQALKEQIGLE